MTFAVPLRAATRTWNGSSRPWSNPGNWGGTIPQPGDDAYVLAGTVTVDVATAALNSLSVAGAVVSGIGFANLIQVETINIGAGGVLTHESCSTNGSPANTNRLLIWCGDTCPSRLAAPLTSLARGLPAASTRADLRTPTGMGLAADRGGRCLA